MITLNTSAWPIGKHSGYTYPNSQRRHTDREHRVQRGSLASGDCKAKSVMSITKPYIYSRHTVKEEKQAKFDTPSSQKHTLFQRNDNDASNDTVVAVTRICQYTSERTCWEEIGFKASRDIDQDQEGSV